MSETAPVTAALTPFATPAAALAHQAAVRPEGEALVFPDSGGRRSFAAWRDDAEALARGLAAIGVEPGDPLALLAENRVEWPVVQLAAAALGALLVPLNTHHRRDDLRYALEQSKARALVLSPAFRDHAYLETLRELRGELPRLEILVALDGRHADCLSYGELLARGRADGRPLPEVAPDDAAALLYTSGTTGFPKGALLSHRAMLANAWGTGQRLGLVPEDRWTSIIPLFHCAGCIMNLLSCLQAGACYVGVPAFDTVAMFETIEAERCTLLSGVPTSYLAMDRHPRRGDFDLSSLRGGTCGGADCDPAVLRRCAETWPIPGLCQVYGQTEAGTLVSCPTPDDPERWATAGRPLPSQEVRVTAPRNGATLAADALGQIEVRGPMTMLGYHRRPEATAETLDAEGWLKTGDLGRLTPEGRLVITGGRLRDMIIRGGENIYPAEIEALLARHPAVAEATVIGLPDDYYGEIVGAVVRLAQPATATALAAHCAEHVAGFKVPAAFFAIEDYPMTPSGKIRKTALRTLVRRERLEPLP